MVTAEHDQEWLDRMWVVDEACAADSDASLQLDELRLRSIGVDIGVVWESDCAASTTTEGGCSGEWVGETVVYERALPQRRGAELPAAHVT